MTKTATTLDIQGVASIQIGRFEIPMRQTTHALVPTNADEYVDEAGTLEALAYGVSSNKAVLLIGETGTGKTSAVRHLAKITNSPYRRVNLNGSTTVDELIGCKILEKGNVVWQDGVLVEAMRNGEWIVLDEINAALPEVLFALQSLLDDDRMVVIHDGASHERTIVKPHADFRLFATMNSAEAGYSGVRDLNKALMSRFGVVVQVEYPSEKTETLIVAERSIRGYDAKEKPIAIQYANLMVKFAHGVRKAKEEEKGEFIVSTRDLINWLSMAVAYAGGPAKLSNTVVRATAESAILYKANKDDRDAMSISLDALVGGVSKDIPLSRKEVMEMIEKNGSAYFRVINEFTGSQRTYSPGDVIHVTFDNSQASVSAYLCKHGSDGSKIKHNAIDKLASNKDWAFGIDHLDQNVVRTIKPARFDEAKIFHRF